MSIRILFEHSEKCRHLLADALGGINPAEFVDVAPGEKSSLRALLMHIVEVEDVWINERLQAKSVPEYNSDDFMAPFALFDRWETVRGATRAFLESLTPEKLQQPVTATLRDGSTRQATVEKILLHVFLHEAHHRGQVAQALRRRGFDPPDFDLV